MIFRSIVHPVTRLSATALAVVLSAAVLSVAGAAVARADALEEAEAAYGAGRYAQAAALLQPLAEQGVARAQFMLGLMHHFGEGGAPDEKAALHWFRRLAAGGYAEAGRDVRALLRVEAQVPEGDPLGIYSYKKAAQNGDPEAQYLFAKVYDEGRGVTENDNIAAAWYREAALQGHAAAEAHLGAMLLQGDGLPMDARAGANHLLTAGREFVEQGRLAEALVILAMVKATAPGQQRTVLLEERIEEQLAARGLPTQAASGN